MESSLDLLLSHPYINKQLIAYIGNKRRLLPFLGEVFSSIEGNSTTFLDPFTGSGSVARLARLMGYDVKANDWEFYSYITASAHVGIDKRKAATLFKSRGGIKSVFDTLNITGSSDSPVPVPYISRYYSPRNTEGADYLTERLFYTRENGEFLDRVRNIIEEWYPGWNLDRDGTDEKNLLLASLLYQGATKANTSGVFKACHKGFGGHGRDALSRIMAPMELEIPLLTDSGSGTVFRQDAGVFAAGHTADICYLDPPYNIHQYGSNYHLLNTLGLWDRPEVDQSRNPDGRFSSKAGIRKDWIETRSPYCSRKTASTSLRELLDTIDARYIVLSYSTDGVVGFPELMEILSFRGDPKVFCRDYVKYRGGRQSVSRRNYNVEFQLVVDTHTPAVSGSIDTAMRFLDEYRLLNLLQEGFHPGRLNDSFPRENGKYILFPDVLELASSGGYRFTELPIRGNLSLLSDDAFNVILSLLKFSVCEDKHDEADVLLELLKSTQSGKELNFYGRQFVRVLKKFSHRKYLHVFEQTMDKAETLIESSEGKLDFLEEKLKKVREISKKRFSS